MKNFGEFFNNQIEHAGTVILSRTQNVSEEKLKTAIELIKSVNQENRNLIFLICHIYPHFRAFALSFHYKRVVKMCSSIKH
jgi:hypothetical protein